MPSNTSSAEFFESKYRVSADPWRFETSPYEQRRYEDTMAALRSRHYGRAFEPGCSVGALTRRLATICDEVVAIEISPTAAKEAQARCRNLRNVHISCASLPNAIPFGPFDLIVLSEIGYYFSIEEWDLILWSLLDEFSPGGMLLAVHWLGTSSDHRLSGDDVHDRIQKLPGLVHTLSVCYERTATERYRLDRWERP